MSLGARSEFACDRGGCIFATLGGAGEAIHQGLAKLLPKLLLTNVRRHRLPIKTFGS